ncbi:N-acetyl-gamma-glutamyl-phosphate reductase [Marinobacteraceae bacterium S3BR75-40.1]
MVDQPKIRVGIVGGTGYTGVELLRLLSVHPQVELVAITSRSEAGTRVDAMFQNLRGYTDLCFTEPRADVLEACDLVFFATPNGVAMHQVPALLEKGVRVVDLSADYRLKDVPTWEQWYGETHQSPEWVEQAVYGLPEMNRTAIREARLVANPGCYPTAIQLALQPLLEARAIQTSHIVADGKSGVSGAGRGAKVPSLMGEMGESFKAYAASGHRHGPEIEQSVSAALGGGECRVTFVPHLIPMVRGMEASVYVELNDPQLDAQALFEKRYQQEPFVDVLPFGSHPETRTVRGANLCRIGLHRQQGRPVLIVSSVIDNLVKGASGQAIQNMNIMFGLDETAGLNAPALLP